MIERPTMDPKADWIDSETNPFPPAQYYLQPSGEAAVRPVLVLHPGSLSKTCLNAPATAALAAVGAAVSESDARVEAVVTEARQILVAQVVREVDSRQE